MKHSPGNWQVVRKCCRSGNCTRCCGALTGKGSLTIVQANGYSEEYAKWVAGNWRSYGAQAVEMPVCKSK